MPRPPQESPAVGNQLLASLPRKTYERLLPDMKLVTLEVDEVIDAPLEPARHVYFPTTAVLSALCVLEKGRRVEICMMGHEGMSGMLGCLGAQKSTGITVVQVAGDAIRIGTRAFRKEFDRNDALHELVLRYIGALVVQISQSVGCNTHHLLEARLSRWLLIVRDRVETDELLLDHAFLSQMLGTGRSAVTLAAGSLRDAGLIRYARGRIKILDHAGLRATSCECYAVVKTAFDRVHGS
jgi:CRP-like cAMP-binding protein